MASVDDYLFKLGDPRLAPWRLLRLLESVRVALSSKPMSWVAQFSEHGMDYLLMTLSRYYYKGDKHQRIILECVRCLRYIIASESGMQLLLCADRAMDLLVKLLDCRYPDVMMETAEALSDFCLSSQPEGCKKVLCSLTSSFHHSRTSRFGSIIAGMIKKNDALTTACLRLANCIIYTANDDDTENELKQEFLEAGIDIILDEGINTSENPNIQAQIQRLVQQNSCCIKR